MSKWLLRASPKKELDPQLAEEFSISPLLLEILWRRGLQDYAQLEEYLDARLGRLTPPVSWPLIPDAAKLLATELLAGKKLAVWGDYDVDGITASAVVLEVLSTHGFELMHHLPDRRLEGYGLNCEGVEKLAKAGCQVLLTVDCGISDHAPIQRARDLGMTVIVSDHHLPPQQLPCAHAFVNPRLPGDWPCVNLAGVGVAFYLMGAVNALLAPATGNRYKMDKALDLVALGTLADVMILQGENRILVRAGLERMAKTTRPGIAALKVASGMALAGDITSEQALFRLVPRMNAAGRMADADIALQMLRAFDYLAAEPMAQELDNRNQQRKTEEKRIFLEAKAQAEKLLEQKNYAGLVLYGTDWHPGIVGIVASRIVEAFHRPALVLCQDGETLKGSGRSVANFDLHAGLGKAADALLGFGGHKMAAGVRLLPENLDKFRESFHAACKDSLGDTVAEQILLLECELDFSLASNESFLKELALMEPFGPGNEEPVFVSPPLLVKKRAFLGKSQEHVLLQVEDEQHRITLGAKGWRMAQSLTPALVGQKIRLAYTPRLDFYNGMPSINLDIRDWKLVR